MLKIKTMPEQGRVFHGKLAGYLLLIPGLLYDAAYLILRPILAYAAPVAFVCIGLYLQLGVFMDMGKDTSDVSNTMTVLWVSLSALGFTWASAVGSQDKDFDFIMGLSKRFMYAGIALILATGFKFALAHSPHDLGLPFFGGLARFILSLIMACFFGQSMLEAFLPLLKLHTYLARGTAYLPGLTLLREQFPHAVPKPGSRARARRDEEAGGEAGAGAPA